jgi:hypothetical protein
VTIASVWTAVAPLQLEVTQKYFISAIRLKEEPLQLSRWQAFALIYCPACSSTLKMEAICSSETSQKYFISAIQ